MTEPKDSQTPVNDPRTQATSDTNVTQPRSGFDLENTRRDLIAKRLAAGADSEIGHRCSNLIELLQNYQIEGEPAVRGGLLKLIEKQMAELAELTK